MAHVVRQWLGVAFSLLFFALRAAVRCACLVLPQCGNFPLTIQFFSQALQLLQGEMGRYALLWLLGVPIPILLLIYLFGGLH